MISIYYSEGFFAQPPPIFLQVAYYLSQACALVYLLMAIWLSMHASIKSHSYATRLLTRRRSGRECGQRHHEKQTVDTLQWMFETNDSYPPKNQGCSLPLRDGNGFPCCYDAPLRIADPHA
ncbi:unnamed protein product [Effrenium voratum]|nr:unnamed protein product [Effrenium voratum]